MFSLACHSSIEIEITEIDIYHYSVNARESHLKRIDLGGQSRNPFFNLNVFNYNIKASQI
jgi:hypothetical protein